MRRADGTAEFDKPDRREDLMQAYDEFFTLSVCECSYAVRIAAAQEIGSGGDRAFEALRSRLSPPPQFEARGGLASQGTETEPEGSGDVDDERQLREQVMGAWMAPMLVSSVAEDSLARSARQTFEEWREYVANSRFADRFPVNLTVALAQGLKSVANQRRRNQYSQGRARTYLAYQAKSMLHNVDFWYARLALLHALTLWSLPDGPDEAHRHRPRQRRSPDALVKQWMARRGNDTEPVTRTSLVEHPFVAYAAELCVLALESGQPERFLWIDECGVLSKTGSGPASKADGRRSDLWIAPSAGWSALDPRGQQLVADVLVFLDLAEGGRGPDEREHRLALTGRSALPPASQRTGRHSTPFGRSGPQAGRSSAQNAPRTACSTCVPSH